MCLTTQSQDFEVVNEMKIEGYSLFELLKY